MTDHTPGPWHLAAKKNCLGTYTIFYGHGETAKNQIGDTPNIADANLIAAAPDLLAACEAVLGIGIMQVDPLAWAKVVNAVAKARGVK